METDQEGLAVYHFWLDHLLDRLPDKFLADVFKVLEQPARVVER